jgi:Uma2 family endonuclease
MKTVTPPAVKLTYDDFVQFPDDGKRHELIDGEHYVTPSPNTKHQRVSMNLAGMLWAWLTDHPMGEVFQAPKRAGIQEYWVVDPEIDVVRVSRLEGEAFSRPVELSRAAGDTLTTPLLPGLALPLARIFQE